MTDPAANTTSQPSASPISAPPASIQSQPQQPQPQHPLPQQQRPHQPTPSSTGTITVLLFAAASTHANDTESLSLPAPITLRALFDELERRFPGMKRKVLSSAAVTRNLEYLDVEVDEVGELVGFGEGEWTGGAGEREGEVWLRGGDEVAVVPPVSSG